MGRASVGRARVLVGGAIFLAGSLFPLRELMGIREWALP